MSDISCHDFHDQLVSNIQSFCWSFWSDVHDIYLIFVCLLALLLMDFEISKKIKFYFITIHLPLTKYCFNWFKNYIQWTNIAIYLCFLFRPTYCLPVLKRCSLGTQPPAPELLIRIQLTCTAPLWLRLAPPLQVGYYDRCSRHRSLVCKMDE